MAGGINIVQIIGNLGDDPKITRKDDFISARISVATSRSWKDKQGNKVENVEWHKVVLFGKIAEIVEKYLSKGDKIYIQGYLKTNKYTDKNNIERYSTEIIAENIQMLGSKKDKQSDEKQTLSQEEHEMVHDYVPGQLKEDDIPF